MKKYVGIAVFILFILLGVTITQFISFHDQKFHLIFCDVGQGDGILMRTPAGKIIVVDGGPDEKILGCLSRHTPFWQRTITLMFLSHPHADHLTGLIPLLDRYVTKYFIAEKLVNKTAGFDTLQEIIQAKHIPEKIVYAGDSMMLSDGVSLRILNPTKKLLEETSPNGVIGERKEFANLITLITYKQFRALLVGDSQAPQLEAVAETIVPGINVMQVPHHGSMTGLSEKALRLLSPKLAVISVGKNTYGHPSPYTLNLLHNAHVPVHMTIKEGDVEIISDGKNTTLR